MEEARGSSNDGYHKTDNITECECGVLGGGHYDAEYSGWLIDVVNMDEMLHILAWSFSVLSSNNFFV